MDYDIRPLVILFPLITSMCAGAAINSLGPPRLVSDSNVIERVVAEGSKVQLPCPVEADPDTLFFEWYRGNEPLNIFHEDRFRVQSNGVLKIKSTVPEDSGVYICRAVNGFGKVETSVNLVVLASGAPNNQNSDAGSLTNYMIGERVAPFLTNTTRTVKDRLSRPVGASIRLLCKASGIPEPDIVWLKNGQPLNNSFSSGWKKSRWSLYIRSIQEEHQGNYTCIAYNVYGHRNYTVTVDVTPGDLKKPELRGIHPINTTVEEGGSAVFQCRVKSENLPHVQWLKQANPDAHETDGLKIIKVQGEYFYILKSTEILERLDGSFINKLVLKDVSIKDAGKYICLGANTIGYSFRSAFLTVHAPETFLADVEEGGSDALTVSFSSLFITIPLLLVLLITFLAILLLHYYRKPRPNPSVLQVKTDGVTEKASAGPPTVFPHVSLMGHPNFHQPLESSDGTWSHVQSSLVIDPGQPDSFSECDSSFVFLGDLNMYPDIMYKDNGHVLSLYSPNPPPSHEKRLCLDRV